MFLFIYWAMTLAISGMYTMYIAQLGFSKKEISILVTIYTVSGLIGQSVIGYLSDKFGQMKKTMLLCVSAGFFIAICLSFARGLYTVSVLIILWGFFINGSVPISDTWCINMLKQYNQERDYGKIRGFGSIGYGLSSVLLGFLLQSFGWHIYAWYIVAGVVLTLFVIWMNDDKCNINRNHKKSDVSLREALTEIFKIKPLLIIILIVFMYNFVVKGIYSYLGLFVSDFGGGPISFGFTYFCDASPEIVTFFLTTKLLKRYDNKIIMNVAFLLQIIRLGVILIFNNALAVILMGVLSGFGFGLMTSSYKTYIYKLSPEKYKASCVSMSETIIGLSAIISAPIFGIMFSLFNANTTILFGLIIDIIMFIVMVFYNVYQYRKN